MNKEELLEFRQKVVGSVRQLALEDDTDPANKLQVLMGLIRSGDSSREAMNAVFEAAQQLPDATEKLDTLLDLIYEIDTQLGSEDGEMPQADEPAPAEESAN